jgi:hypothetical protein
MSEGGYGEAAEAESYGGGEQGQENQQPDIASQVAQLSQQLNALNTWATYTTDYINGKGQQKEEPWAAQYNELRQGIADIVSILTKNNESWQGHLTQQQALMAQQQQAQYESQVQAVGQYSEAARQELGQQLEKEGYSGFAENWPLVQSTIINAIPWAQNDPQTFWQQISIANDPAFWGVVYTQNVIPKLAAFNSTYRRSENLRNVTENNSDAWNNNDYINMRAQSELGGLVE